MFTFTVVVIAVLLVVCVCLAVYIKINNCSFVKGEQQRDFIRHLQTELAKEKEWRESIEEESKKKSPIFFRMLEHVRFKRLLPAKLGYDGELAYDAEWTDYQSTQNKSGYNLIFHSEPIKVGSQSWIVKITWHAGHSTEVRVVELEKCVFVPSDPKM